MRKEGRKAAMVFLERDEIRGGGGRLVCQLIFNLSDYHRYAGMLQCVGGTGKPG